MWYTERRYRHPTDSRKERHNEEERIFGRRGSAEYQLGGVPEDHEKSGRKAEKREKAEIVQTAPFGCAEGGSDCRKSQRLFRQPRKNGASRPFAVCKREIALLSAVLAAYLWAGGDVMSIGNQIMVIRRAQQLTQEQFGSLFHVTRQTVSNWENGVSHS